MATMKRNLPELLAPAGSPEALRAAIAAGADAVYFGGGGFNARMRAQNFTDEDVEKAMEPFFTTDREGERSGMGLPIIRAFCDSVRVVSRPGFTRLTMKKKL
jgi:anti-sigma regulatory factor (Ser/Thr protein kinase)